MSLVKAKTFSVSQCKMPQFIVWSPKLSPQIVSFLSLTYSINYSLRTTEKPLLNSIAFKSIDAEVIIELLMKLTADEFTNKYALIDCRYPFEYNGGHIKLAVNIYDRKKLVDYFYPNDALRFIEISRKIPIFYCEYSKIRGPNMAYALRAEDRIRNKLNYPMVDYLEMYILDRGYKNFYEINQRINKDCCEPDAYIPMNDPRFISDLMNYDLHRSKSTSGTKSKSMKKQWKRKKRKKTSLDPVLEEV
ncbi:unnamed protein product [Dracunculus medinensis]|uniref:protein-tyrosine-phosphatase n=1 Tax=Dracunculus medinensis TaxID=318479 RepID=A0A3P7P3X7_DRAME|nr:unnamed protein product [Dracunculus medinensis]